MIDWKRVQDTLDRVDRRLAQTQTGSADVHGILLAIHADVQRLATFIQTVLVPMRAPAASQHDAEQDRRLDSLGARIRRPQVALWQLLIAVVAAIVGGFATAKFTK